MYQLNLQFVSLPVPEIIRLEFWVGVANPNLGEEEALDGMVPFERALVSFYRLSMLTFPLYLRVSEILLLLCSSMPLFPTPPLVSPKFSHVPIGVGPRWMAFGLRRAKVLG